MKPPEGPPLVGYKGQRTYLLFSIRFVNCVEAANADPEIVSSKNAKPAYLCKRILRLKTDFDSGLSITNRSVAGLYYAIGRLNAQF